MSFLGINFGEVIAKKQKLSSKGLVLRAQRLATFEHLLYAISAASVEVVEGFVLPNLGREVGFGLSNGLPRRNSVGQRAFGKLPRLVRFGCLFLCQCRLRYGLGRCGTSSL